jgi:hypothetical protein
MFHDMDPHKARAGRQYFLEFEFVHMTVSNKSLEQRLAHAYALLSYVSEDEPYSRAVSLERCGPFDVRLIEVTRDRPETAAKSLFLELYDHDRGIALDSCICDGIKDAAIAAEELISLARELEKG